MDKVREYRLGDMTLRYERDEEDRIGLVMYPPGLPLPLQTKKQAAMDPLVQVKLAGDVYTGGYAQGGTLRQSQSTMALHLVEQKMEQQAFLKDGARQCVKTVLADARGYEAVHTVSWEEGDRFVRMHTSYENKSDEAIRLELLSSFSLTGLSPYLPGDCSGDITVHRLQSRWSQEGRLLSQTLEDLQLESSWGLDAVRCERFGQVGSMPVNHYFPFLAVEDTKNHVFWGAQLAQPASWQMEIYRCDENIAISGGLADREFGHWMKELAPGECFTTPEAIVTTAYLPPEFVWKGAHEDGNRREMSVEIVGYEPDATGLDLLCERLVEAGERAADEGPASEQELPIIFNEYCTTWGDPSHENIVGILDSIRGKGFSYFVIDCGWYRADGVPWDISMGDYLPSKTLFPEGLDRTVQAINDAGMKAGIWFEIENVGHASDAFRQTEHLLKRDGETLTTCRRRFWDMQDEWVRDYLRERVIGTLKKYGFEYMKIDYNDTIGIGCDGAESLGEGLRRNMQATMDFFEEIKREVPGIILENCASGGHRLEPGFMGATAMASFSDAHECVEIPIIAANLHRAILPRQSQIWAVIRETDSRKRIAYSIANTFLGRMCLSGDVTNLSEEQWEVIDRGIAFYREIAPIIKKGQTYHLSPAVARMRHPEGWQGIVRVGENGEAYALIHTFGGSFPETIGLKLPHDVPTTIRNTYSDTEPEVWMEGDVLYCRPRENWKAVAVRLGSGKGA